jgi:16S rRNA (cytosine967-C5)-methyltransferase
MYKNIALDLVKIFNENAYLSIVLDNSIKMLKLDINSKKVYTKIIYGVCEKRLLIDYNLSPLIKGKRVKPFIKNMLRIGVYVIDYMNMKDHFIVNELVKIVKKEDYNSAMFINGVLRNYQRTPKPVLDKLNDVEKISLELSLPLDLAKLLYHQYKDKLKDFFKVGSSINTYRINTLKVDIDTLCSKLKSDGIEFENEDVIIQTKVSLINTAYFKEGLIIAQDAKGAADAMREHLDKSLQRYNYR